MPKFKTATKKTMKKYLNNDGSLSDKILDTLGFNIFTLDYEVIDEGNYNTFFRKFKVNIRKNFKTKPEDTFIVKLHDFIININNQQKHFSTLTELRNHISKFSNNDKDILINLFGCEDLDESNATTFHNNYFTECEAAFNENKPLNNRPFELDYSSIFRPKESKIVVNVKTGEEINLNNYSYNDFSLNFINNSSLKSCVLGIHTKEDEFICYNVTPFNNKLSDTYLTTSKFGYAYSEFSNEKLIKNNNIISYKNDIEILEELSYNLKDHIINIIYKNRNKKLKEIEDRDYNSVELIDNETAILKLVSTLNKQAEILITTQGKCELYVSGNKISKSDFINGIRYIPASFKINEEVKNCNNRIANYYYFFNNILDFDWLYSRIDGRTNKTRVNSFGTIRAEDLLNILESNRVESFLAIYDKIPALKNINNLFDNDMQLFNLMNYLFPLYNKDFNKDELNKNILKSIVPRPNLLFNIKSLPSLMGIRLMERYDTGTGIFNSIRGYSNEQLEEVGEKFFRIAVLTSIGNLYTVNKYKNNDLDYFIRNTQLRNNRNNLLFAMNIKNSYKSTIKEINELLELLEVSTGINLNNIDLVKFYNSGKYWTNKHNLEDGAYMFRELNPNKTFKDYLNLLKHYQNTNRDVITLHDELQAQRRAIDDELNERKYKQICESQQTKDYKGNKLSIIKPNKLKDVVDEGSNLHHCVGFYTTFILNATSFIYFMRKNENLNESYMTIEVKDGQINQVQGSPNNKFLNKDSKDEIKALKEFAKINNIKLDINNLTI